ncbi:MAG: MFS transporter [Clostridia bacterium]|nr:MFS transporter [Clostridia bacterium]
MENVNNLTAESNPENSSGTVYRWRVLTGCTLTYLYDVLDLSILAICLPLVIKEFGVPLSQAGMLSSATLLGGAIGGIIYGYLGDNYGRKLVCVIGLCQTGLFTLFVFFVHDWNTFLALRFMAGFSAGGLYGPLVALINEHWAPKYRATASSFMASTAAVASIIAGLMGRMMGTYNWRFLFLIVGSGIITALIFQLIVPTTTEGKKKIVREKVSFSEIFKPGIRKSTILATLVAACVMGGYWGAVTWIPTFLMTVRGLSIEQMSNFSIILFLGMFAGYYIFAQVADRIGRRIALLIAFGLATVLLPVYVFTNNAMLLFWISPVLGAQFGGMFGTFAAFFAELFPKKIRGFGSGFAFNAGRGIGSILAPVTIGVLGSTYGLSFGLLCAAVLFFIGLVISFFMPETLGKLDD